MRKNKRCYSIQTKVPTKKKIKINGRNWHVMCIKQGFFCNNHSCSGGEQNREMHVEKRVMVGGGRKDKTNVIRKKSKTKQLNNLST